MIFKRIMLLFIFLITALVFFVLFFNSSSPNWQISKKIKYLSYIPPLDVYGTIEPIYTVSLEKLHVFQESSMDDFAKREQLIPVIDKVLYVPDGFHEYASLDRHNSAGKIG